jgi:hypothetical protein
MPIFDFHPVLLAIPFLLWAIDAAERGHPFPFFFAHFMALTCKEDVAVATASVSLFALLVRRRWWGSLGLLMSFLWFWVATTLIGKFGGIEQSPYFVLYARWGKTPTDILFEPFATTPSSPSSLSLLPRSHERPWRLSFAVIGAARFSPSFSP